MEAPDEWVAVFVGCVVTLTGLVFVVSDGYYASPTGPIPVDVSSVLLFVTAMGTVLAGVWLLVERPGNEHVLRVLVWWGGGMALTLFMATSLLHHQSQLGVQIMTPDAVRNNSLTVGSTGGLLIAYFYTKANQSTASLATEHDRVRREKERLEVLHRMIQHDIRNDMNVVLGWVDRLGEGASAEQRPTVDQIHAASEHVVELTDLSRDYVAVIVEGDSMELKPMELAEVLRMELQTCADVYPNAEFVVPGDLPSVSVTGNELLSSVFRNLLNNAVQHNDADAPRVEVAVERRSDVVRVTIADNGPGVPEGQKDAVFGKGELGLESAGTGIGLYLVNVLVAEYGGAVWIEDNDHAGSTVVVELHRALDDRTPATPNTGVAPEQA